MTNETLEVTIDGARVNVSPALLEKYNQPGPRYTSYPTAPEWDDGFGPQDFIQAVKAADAKPDPAPLSLYFHIPFCRSLCLYCGCNVVISKDREVSIPYFEHLKREIDWVSSETSRSRKVEQLHWGGGTPTFISPDQIENLYTYISDRFTISDTA